MKCQALNAIESLLNIYLSQVPAHSNFSFFFFFERHIIAALYFNLNLFRELKKNADGTEQVKVVWPKFKNGEATVRDVKVKPNFGKIFFTCRLKQIHDLNYQSSANSRNYFLEFFYSLPPNESSVLLLLQNMWRTSIKCILNLRQKASLGLPCRN